MNILGIPVPPGFTLTTEVCTEYYRNDESFPESLAAEVKKSLKPFSFIRGSSGHPRVLRGHKPELNQVSRTSGSW